MSDVVPADESLAWEATVALSCGRLRVGPRPLIDALLRYALLGMLPCCGVGDPLRWATSILSCCEARYRRMRCKRSSRPHFKGEGLGGGGCVSPSPSLLRWTQDRPPLKGWEFTDVSADAAAIALASPAESAIINLLSSLFHVPVGGGDP